MRFSSFLMENIMNKDKKIALQQKLIQTLTTENQKLKEELELAKYVPNEGYAKTKKLIEELQDKMNQYNHLIEEIQSLKKIYNEKINQLNTLKKDFKKKAGQTINSIQKGIR